ncbi:hypothetical protein M2139_001485 [Enterococcus sp. PF1-24]|uniref:hypothetical protein n=1 Tax=unclassified Enterococcus TaxID=2608891 RepID=UPI0024765E51|nr:MULTISPECIES: hypothetical protein [unclassified Enterococcus]MDH6364524.1 hypothetical protein [Enterococcus sp. PFB1-1]MDH6401599.1 hypothetical protein [Enterococcus sp. PF1-24]
MKKKSMYISEAVEEILNDVVKQEPHIENRSQALRFLVLRNYEEYSNQKKKLTAMSKEMSVILELVSSLTESLHTEIIDKDESETYSDALDNVNKRIKRNLSRSR